MRGWGLGLVGMSHKCQHKFSKLTHHVEHHNRPSKYEHRNLVLMICYSNLLIMSLGCDTEQNFNHTL